VQVNPVVPGAKPLEKSVAVVMPCLQGQSVLWPAGFPAP